MWSFPKFSSLDFLIVSPTPLFLDRIMAFQLLERPPPQQQQLQRRARSWLHPTTEFQHKLPTSILNFLSFYCCWCLTLLDTFVIGEVRRNFVFCNCSISRLFGGRFPRFSRYIRRSFIKYLHHLLCFCRETSQRIFFPAFLSCWVWYFHFVIFLLGKEKYINAASKACLSLSLILHMPG